MSIPLIATRNTAEVNDAIGSGHGGRPMLGSSGVDANVHANGGATAEQAPYLLTVQSTGSVDGYGLYEITVAEDTITFKMTDNTTELIDGDWWNRDVTLYIGWADGTVSEKTVHFLQM